MPIGNAVSMAGLNVQLGDTAVSIRDALFLANKLWSFIVLLGTNQAAQVAALQSTYGFTATDAQNFWTAANQCFAVWQLYTGQITQPATFNYDSALGNARGAA